MTTKMTKILKTFKTRFETLKTELSRAKVKAHEATKRHFHSDTLAEGWARLSGAGPTPAYA